MTPLVSHRSPQAAATIMTHISRFQLALATHYLVLGDPIAFKYLLRCHNNNFHQASAILGLLFEFGYLVPQCFKTAEKLYLKAAKSLNGIACSRLSFLRIHGRMGVMIDHSESDHYKSLVTEDSLYWLFATSSDLAISSVSLGLCYYNSVGLVYNERAAFDMFSRAASKGLACAMNMVGNMYLDGTGVVANSDYALQWYIQAAEHREAAAIYNIGSLYEHGISIDRSYEFAYEWYIRASIHGSIPAYNVLGIFHEKGHAVDIDLVEAMKWYNKGAYYGNPHSQYNLGRLHHENFEIKNDSMALMWFEKAAKQFHEMAQISSGVCHQYAIGTVKNIPKAIEMYSQAYKQHNSTFAGRQLYPLIAFDMLKASRILFRKYTKEETKGTNLTDLPRELLILIFEYLNYENIIPPQIQDKIMEMGTFAHYREELEAFEELEIPITKSRCDCIGVCKTISHRRFMYEAVVV